MTNTYKLNEKYRGRFLKLPKELFELERYRSLSSESKLLYAILLDRTGLSEKNRIANEHGEIYAVMKREEAGALLGYEKRKISRLFAELNAARLIAEEKTNFGSANRIYVLKPCTENAPSMYTNYAPSTGADYVPSTDTNYVPSKRAVCAPSKDTKRATVDATKMHPLNDNNINNTDLNETDKNNIGHTTSNNTRVLTDIEIMEKILARCDQSKLTPYVKINVRGAIGYALKCEGMTVDGVFLEKDEVMKLINKINTECLNRMSDLLLTLNWHRNMTTEQRSEVLMKAIMEVHKIGKLS